MPSNFYKLFISFGKVRADDVYSMAPPRIPQTRRHAPNLSRSRRKTALDFVHGSIFLKSAEIEMA
jgi:hypothetical protein